MRSDLNSLRQEESNLEQQVEKAKSDLDSIMKQHKDSQQQLSKVSGR